MALTVTAQRARLERMVQWQEAPALTAAEVDDLLAYARKFDVNGIEPDPYTEWAAGAAVSSGTRRTPTVRNGFVYQAVGSGTTGSTEPVWPTVIGQTVTSGSVTWRCEAAAPWIPTFDLRAAAAEGWQWKAGKVASQFDAQAGSASAKRSQVFEMCMANARAYRTSGGIGLAVVGSSLL